MPLRPDARFARGGVTISLGGFGYDTLAQPGTYTCVWSLMADVGQANASNVDWDLSLSVDARVLSSVLVSCVTPKWGASFAADNATLFLFVGDALIPDPVPFRFHTVADSIRPSFSESVIWTDNVFLNAKGERQLFIHPDCKLMLRGLEQQPYDQATQQPAKGDGGVDDLSGKMDALGYACWQLRGIKSWRTGPTGWSVY